MATKRKTAKAAPQGVGKPGKAAQFAKAPGWSAIRDRDKGREAVMPEHKGEDGLSSGYAQVRLIAAQREAYRNTVFSPATAQQLKVNVVGVPGGRLTFTTDDETFNRSAGTAFRRWARHAEFAKGKSFNEVLKLLLVELTHHGGDFIAVFDDGILTGGKGSGKIRVFEADEIANVTDAHFAKAWGKGYHQTKGIVTDRFGRVCGAFVSNALRGRDVFDDPKKVIALRLGTPADWTDSNWIFVSQDWRLGQIRGTATVTHIVNTLDDIQSIVSSEVQAAKINSALGVIVSDREAQPDNSGLRGLGPTTEGVGGEDGMAGADDSDAPVEPPPAATITGLREGMAAIVDVAPGKQVQSFDTKRPNLNVSQFIRDQTGACITVFGMGLTYATLDPATSYSAFRGAMKLASLSFVDLQKKLERDFCDWVALRAVAWLGYKAPENVDECLFWQWAKMPEIDEGAYQSALEKKFANLGASLKGEQGSDWMANIDQTRREIAYCKFGAAWESHLGEVQVVHPSERTVSGQIAEQPENESDGGEEEPQPRPVPGDTSPGDEEPLDPQEGDNEK